MKVQNATELRKILTEAQVQKKWVGVKFEEAQGPSFAVFEKPSKVVEFIIRKIEEPVSGEFPIFDSLEIQIVDPRHMTSKLK